MALPLAPILASLAGVLINVAGSVVGRVLIALGISVITYTGFSVSIGWLKTQMLSSINGLPVEVIGMLSTMKVGVCVSPCCLAPSSPVWRVRASLVTSSRSG